MKHLFKAIEAEKLNRLKEFTAEVRKADLAYLLEQCGKYRRFSDLIPRGKDMSKMSEKELKTYLIDRQTKRIYKAIEAEAARLERIKQAGDLTAIKINIEWTKSATWGANPKGEGWAQFRTKDGMHSERKSCAGVTGCGFDKLSTAVANVLNQFDSVLKALYKYKEKELKKGTNTGLRDMFGYGSGYGILPHFEGGVGVECFPAIFDKIGFKFERISGGKTFDVFQITKK